MVGSLLQEASKRAASPSRSVEIKRMRDLSRNVCFTEFQFTGRYLAGQVVLVQIVLTRSICQELRQLELSGQQWFLAVP